MTASNTNIALDVLGNFDKYMELLLCEFLQGQKKKKAHLGFMTASVNVFFFPEEGW